MSEIIIRENINQYIADLKKWLDSNKNTPLEKMDKFFTKRVEGYEKHMSGWKEAYGAMAKLVPDSTRFLLDIGCGTGLELDEILKTHPQMNVVGIDISQVMLDRLKLKHNREIIRLICGDYFDVELDNENFDTAVSFQTLHHFRPERKIELFKKIHSSLKQNGLYIECDYLACCDEEEELLFTECARKRLTEGITDDIYVHFDTPLTAEHETYLLKSAGFSNVKLISCINGACIIVAMK